QPSACQAFVRTSVRREGGIRGPWSLKRPTRTFWESEAWGGGENVHNAARQTHPVVSRHRWTFSASGTISNEQSEQGIFQRHQSPTIVVNAISQTRTTIEPRLTNRK